MSAADGIFTARTRATAEGAAGRAEGMGTCNPLPAFQRRNTEHLQSLTGFEDMPNGAIVRIYPVMLSFPASIVSSWNERQLGPLLNGEKQFPNGPRGRPGDITCTRLRSARSDPNRSILT
jgi:hypothetical protein